MNGSDEDFASVVEASTVPVLVDMLADLLPDGRLVEIADSYTVVPLDQPQKLANAVRAFITSTAGHPR